jgi:hypothetical protein
VVWDEPRRLPDQLPDNDRTEDCTGPDTPGRSVSVDDEPMRWPGRVHTEEVTGSQEVPKAVALQTPVACRSRHHPRSAWSSQFLSSELLAFDHHFATSPLRLRMVKTPSCGRSATRPSMSPDRTGSGIRQERLYLTGPGSPEHKCDASPLIPEGCHGLVVVASVRGYGRFPTAAHRRRVFVADY